MMGTPLNILLIDDDPLEHRIFGSYLTLARQQTQLYSVQSLEAAIKILERTPMDVIFLDDYLNQDTNSRDSIPILSPYLRAAKIIIISNSISGQHLNDPAALGAEAVVDKADIKPVIFDLRRILNGSPDGPREHIQKPKRNTGSTFQMGSMRK